MQVTQEYPRKSPHRIYYPEDRLPLVKLIPMGIQHVIAMSEGRATPAQPEKNPAAVALGRLGGLKGGKARAAKLSKAKRTAIAKKAARARWATR